MAKKGRMTRKKMAVTMPVDAPLYGKLPIYYKDCEQITLRYETEEEVVLDVLPDILELPSPPVISIQIMNFQFCTLGPYKEAFMSVRATFKGKNIEYVLYNLLTCDAALAVGREVWGVPKKIAHVNLERHEEGIVGIVERPRGNRILTGIVRPETPKPIDPQKPTTQIGDAPLVSLRIIPHPEGKDSLIQLIDHFSAETANFKPGEGWVQFQGAGSLDFPTHSDIDPWYKIKVVRMIEGLYIYGPSSYELNYGKILETYK